MRRFGRDCCSFNYFRAKWTPEQELQNLGKPKEALTEIDGIPSIDKPEEQDILIIRSIDPCIKLNGTTHNTSLFELMTRPKDPQLVLRRGQSFQLELTLSRPYNEETDGISFIFTVEDEEKPNHGSGTLIAVPLLKKPNKLLSWNVIVQSSTDNILTVQVSTSSEAIVAKWKMDIDTKIIDNGAYSYSWSTLIYLLFNPWLNTDQVYLKSSEWREETVLNDLGLIWRGTYNKLKPVIWKYDQFEKDVLDCALYLVSVIGKVKGSFRGDAVRTSRALAASINSYDDEGAIMGNWTENYRGGTAPTKWLGSKLILQEYYKKKKPVKFGQCWVFSGVLTTVCRALGIPTRTVTNYSSAHDTQNSLTVDYLMDESGRILDELNSDSVWNFHVWNEVWMTRPDMGREYSGWQAIDATPQEISEEMFRVGPASVVAVKSGEVLRPYDCGFLFAEVNADKIFWKYSGPNQPLKLLAKDSNGIGKLICTKAPLSFEREDITSSYKFPEKSSEERSTMLKALNQSDSLFSRYYLNEEFNDVRFNLVLLDDIKIGQDFTVTLQITNKNVIQDYKVKVTLRVDVVNYRGKIGDSVKTETFDLTVNSKEPSEANLPVSFSEYSKRLRDQASFNISCMASVQDTKFEYFAQDDFRVRKPDIKIRIQEKLIENREATAELSIENSLPIDLTKGEFTVEVPGSDKSLRIGVKGKVAAGQEAKGLVTFTPTKTGRFSIAAKFSCKQFDDADGFLVVIVEPEPSEEEPQN